MDTLLFVGSKPKIWGEKDTLCSKKKATRFSIMYTKRCKQGATHVSN